MAGGYSADAQSPDRFEEARLIRLARAGDRKALHRLVEANLRLVYKIARRYRCRSYTIEDLVQEGIVGLMAAIERFDETRGFRLSTYALHWIRQSIARAVEQNDRMIHIPMQATAEIRRLTRLREELAREQGRQPSTAELARETGLSEERVDQLLGTTEDAFSLESTVGAEQDTSLLDLAEDPTAADPEDEALRGFSRQHVRGLIECLNPRERWVLAERYGLDGRSPQTLDEVSRALRISRERVRQIEVRAMQKLRHALRASHWD
jgi:RNA polymerase sigma factor (sigma-70 family)